MKSEVKSKEEEMDAMWGEEAQGKDSDPKCAWFQHDRYSMFIHWGLYSLLAGQWKGRTYYGIGEWIMHQNMAGISVEDYKKLAGDFNPTEFNAAFLVGLAKEAGMKCIVITAKHHEGFALFDSPASEFSITQASPFGRDIMKELSEECEREGLRLGFYYSQYQDWVEPDGGQSKCVLPEDHVPDFDRYFNGKVVPQVRELLSQYGPISIVWFDTPGRMSKAHSQQLVDLVHELQPDCLVNSRVGNGLGDYSTLGDMELPAVTIKDKVVECVDTTNNSWAFAHYDSDWKSPSTICRNLVKAVSRNSNYMLNVGPDGFGSIPSPAVHALRESGNWIRHHGDAIYGTRPSPFPPFSWGDCTSKGKELFVHVFDWPRRGHLNLGAMGGKVLKVELFKGGTPLAFDQEGEVLSIALPPVVPDPIISVIRVTLDSEPIALHQAISLDGEHSSHLIPEVAELKGVSSRGTGWMETFGEWKAAGNLTSWFDEKDSEASWEINVLEEGRYSLSVEYACTKEHEGSEWVIRLEDQEVIFPALSTNQDENPGGKVRMRYRNVQQGMLEIKGLGLKKLKLAPKRGSKEGDIWVTRLTLSPWR